MVWSDRKKLIKAPSSQLAIFIHTFIVHKCGLVEWLFTNLDIHTILFALQTLWRDAFIWTGVTWGILKDKSSPPFLFMAKTWGDNQFFASSILCFSFHCTTFLQEILATPVIIIIILRVRKARLPFICWVSRKWREETG